MLRVRADVGSTCLGAERARVQLGLCFGARTEYKFVCGLSQAGGGGGGASAGMIKRPAQVSSTYYNYDEKKN